MTLAYSLAFFTDLGKTYDTPFDIAPAQTIEPGQRMRFQLSQGKAWYSWTMANIHYTFTDINGGRHRCDYNVDSSGNPYTFSFDVSADGSLHDSTATFYMAPDPDGNQNDIDAVLSHPAVATIDAQKQPAEAASMMMLWPEGTSKNFTPTTGLTFNTGPFHRVSALVYNASNEDASLTLKGSDTEDETTSIGLKLGWSTDLDILGLADEKISASITGGHSWTTGVTVSDSDQVLINPGWEGWIESAVTSATVTGNFSFATPQGITYNVLGATVTEPGFGPHGSNGAITFEPNGKPFNPTEDTKGILYRGPRASHKPHIKRTRARSRCASYQGRIGKTRGCVHWLTNVGDGTVVIDAKADPKAAAAAMALWDAATNKSFVATSNPIYANTDQAIVSQYWRTPANWQHPSTGSLIAEQHSSSSWSLGGSVGAETTLSALGFANASVSVEFTAEHQWVTSHADSQAISVTVDPGYVGWIEGCNSQVSLTGDYTFTVNGVTYQVNNLTITEQGNASNSPTTAAYTYIVKEQKQSSLGLRDHRPPSRGPGKKLRRLLQNPKALTAPVSTKRPGQIAAGSGR
jgi:hypothetical protein